MQSVREIYNTYEELKPATPIGWAKEAWGIYNTYEELKLLFSSISLFSINGIYNTYEELKLGGKYCET